MKYSSAQEKSQLAGRWRGYHRIDFLIGGLVCAIAALAASLVAAGHSWEVSVPLFFSVVLLLTALRFGARAGILGTLAASLIFAVFLFRPLGSLHVANETARANLVWMLLMGIVFSFLFAPHRGFAVHEYQILKQRNQNAGHPKGLRNIANQGSRPPYSAGGI
jgi:K+-sensing histidine kinase KdpD